MNKIRCYLNDFYHIATVIGIVFVTWKIARHWHAGPAEKAGQTIDKSIRAAAEKL
jgi:hypothetical protein